VPPPVPEDRSWSPPPGDESPTTEQAPTELGGLLTGLVPTGLRGGRWDPGRRGLPVLAAAAVVAALVAGVVVLRARPHEITAPTAEVAAPAAEAGGFVVVDVAGKVRHPGIVRLPLGSRVDDALRAAGGPLPGASFDGLNRARKLTDGEQVLVGVQPAAGLGSAGSPGDARVDLNAADVAALDGLPGIGPVLAQKIVDWRTEHGRFASVDQLREVSGIGESKFAALKSKVRT
jgi:competence protein ComEA